MRTPLVLLALTAALTPAVASAQATPFATTILRRPRVDLAMSVGWLNSNVSWLSGVQDDWTNGQATVGIHGGYYWTEHLKTEAVVERSSTADAWSYEQVVLPAAMTAVIGAHDIRYTRVSVGQFYQFGHNAWVHAAAGTGVSLTARRLRSHFQQVDYSDPGGNRFVGPQLTDEQTSETIVRAYVATVLKAYVTQRAFFRADAQADFRSTLEHLVVRAGFGVDF